MAYEPETKPVPSLVEGAEGHISALSTAARNETLDTIHRDFVALTHRLERFMQEHKRRMDDIKRTIG